MPADTPDTLTVTTAPTLGAVFKMVFPAFFALSELCERNPTLERFAIYTSAYFLALFNLLYMNWYWAG